MPSVVHGSSPGRTEAIIIFFLVTICVSAVLELVPPFAFRSILDDAIPKHDRSMINLLAALVVGSASPTPCWPSCSAGARRGSARG